MPTGTPSDVIPTGTDNAGKPVLALNCAVIPVCASPMRATRRRSTG